MVGKAQRGIQEHAMLGPTAFHGLGMKPDAASDIGGADRRDRVLPDQGEVRVQRQGAGQPTRIAELGVGGA